MRWACPGRQQRHETFFDSRADPFCLETETEVLYALPDPQVRSTTPLISFLLDDDKQIRSLLPRSPLV